ncbi:unnamed protein product, partial [Vitis vinifera]
MAESFAFNIADKLLGKATSLVVEQVCLAGGVYSELENIKATLSTVRAVLLDAEEQQVNNHQLTDWLGKLKDCFYDAEDMGNKMKEIRERLDKVAADADKFNLKKMGVNVPVPVLNRKRENYSFVRASDVIGRDDDKENIIQLLMQSSDEENVSVLPLVGIGGLGKTTLAKLVYNDGRNRDKWLELKALLDGGAKGSKIIVTTRDKLVAFCLSLFITYWLRVRDSEIWKLEQKKDDVLPALKLSYDELPFDLKQCFAFCSLYPKDFEFLNITLIEMWMGQGLIRPSEQNEEMEDIGHRYIDELLQKSFFQDVEEDIPGFFYSFKMHDLVHDLALLVAQPECSMLNFDSENISTKVRHRLPNSICKLHHLQTLNLLGYCSELLALPEGMGHLTALRQLQIERCPKLAERCKPRTGEDWNKIAHVKDIYLNGQKIQVT